MESRDLVWDGKASVELSGGDINLSYLNLDMSTIDNLDFMYHITGLKELDLYSFKNKMDGTVLGSLGSLKTLDLEYGKFQDYGFLQYLTNLQYLYLNHCSLDDLSPLATLTNLRELDLNYNQIYDITPLATLTDLQTLNLIDNQIYDITPLSTLTNLQTLNLGYNKITNLKPLENLTNLQELNLQNNSITDTAGYTENNVSKTANNINILLNLNKNGALKKLYLNGNSGISDNGKTLLNGVQWTSKSGF